MSACLHLQLLTLRIFPGWMGPSPENVITKAREIDFHVIMKNSDATSMRNRSGNLPGT